MPATPDRSPSPLRVAVAGASGRMGQMLIEAVCAADDMTLAGVLDRPDGPALGTDPVAFLGRTSGLSVSADVDQVVASADVLIDFTQPAGTLAHLAACRRHGTRLVIGTTGFSDEQRRQIERAGDEIAIVLSPNMSVGVNVTLKLIEMATRALGSDHDIEVIEAHHRMKVDAPSGTAIRIGEVIAQALGRPLGDIATWTRQGHTGPRENGSVGFSVIRGGDIVGDHTVLYAGPGERIEITHRSASRATYAQGSLRACRFLAGHRRGLFGMDDVLGL